MKRDGKYYYVRHIPKDLTQHYSIQRLCFSLKTNSDSIAIRYSISENKSIDLYTSNALNTQDLGQLLRSKDRKFGVKFILFY